LKRYLSILKLFLKAKLVFKNPQKHELVIFDDESAGEFKNFIYHYNFFVLQSRIENINKIYFSFKILKYFFRHYNGNIMTAYLISLLEIIQPKIVLTFIDNSFKFFDLARVLDKKINFVAVQNAARHDLIEHKHLYKKNIIKSDLTKNFYIPNFLCFGQFEIDHYKQYKIKVKNFFKIGSLRLANFFYHIKKNKIKLKKFSYDICLIGETIPGFADENLKNIEKGFANMLKFAIKFCIKHNMKLICAPKSDKKISPKAYNEEINLFKKYLTNNEFDFFISNSLEKKGDIYASYAAMFQSKVVVGTASTLLRENLAMGGKILSCNLLPTNIYDFPIQGICSVKNCTFEEFEKRLLQIYSISEKDYFSKLSKDKCYAVEYDEKISTIEILKRKIDLFLADNY
jgi:surface carbohydrate biosynthesis protein